MNNKKTFVMAGYVAKVLPRDAAYALVREAKKLGRSRVVAAERANFKETRDRVNSWERRRIEAKVAGEKFNEPKPAPVNTNLPEDFEAEPRAREEFDRLVERIKLDYPKHFRGS